MTSCLPSRDYRDAANEKITVNVLHVTSHGSPVPSDSVHEGTIEIGVYFDGCENRLGREACVDCNEVPFVNAKVCRAWIEVLFYGTMKERMAYADSIKTRDHFEPKNCIELLAPRMRQQNSKGGYVFTFDAVKKVPCP